MNVILDIAALLSALVWPAVLAFVLYTYRNHLPGFFGKLVERVNKVDVAGVSLELAQAKPFVPDWPSSAQVPDLRHQATAIQLTDSSRASFLSQLNDQGSGDFAEINLGNGEEWLTSRLYIISILFARMKGLECFVFLETVNSLRRRYVGWAEPEKIRWALARHYPWLEIAYADAYAEITGQRSATVVTQHGRIGYPYAPLDAMASIDLLSAFLRRVQSSIPPAVPASAPADTDHVRIDPATREHAHWLRADMLEQILGPDLNTSCIKAAELQKGTGLAQMKPALDAKGDFVAVVTDEMRYDHLLRRDLLMEQVAKVMAAGAAATG
jgi:hypothetical protein